MTGPGMDFIIIVIGVPVVIELLGVHGGKQIRDGNMHGTTVHTVAAGGTGDQILSPEYLLHLLHGGKLLLV